LSTAIDLDDNTASLDPALHVASYFELDLSQARKIAAEVGAAVSGWRDHARQVGLPVGELERMASAFEHDDLASALSGLDAL
jgi:serine/threonine-protein kinase HipA